MLRLHCWWKRWKSLWKSGGPPRGGTVPRRRRTPPEHISARLHPASSWRRRLETRTTRNLGIPALRSPCHPSTSTGRRRLSGYHDRPPQRRVPGGARGRPTPTQASPSLGSPSWGKSPSPSWGKPASPSAASPIALGMGGVQREYAAMGSKGVLEPDRGLPSDQPGEVHSEFITPVGPADDCREAGDTRAPRVLPGGAGHGHVGHTAAQ